METTNNQELNANEGNRLAGSSKYCMTTTKIISDGEPVRYMYREEPDDNMDSGWRFLAGTETPDYMKNEDNIYYQEVNTIAHYDPAIVPYMDAPYRTEFERVEGENDFRQINTGFFQF